MRLLHRVFFHVLPDPWWTRWCAWRGVEGPSRFEVKLARLECVEHQTSAFRALRLLLQAYFAGLAIGTVHWLTGSNLLDSISFAFPILLVLGLIYGWLVPRDVYRKAKSQHEALVRQVEEVVEHGDQKVTLMAQANRILEARQHPAHLR